MALVTWALGRGGVRGTERNSPGAQADPVPRCLRAGTVVMTAAKGRAPCGPARGSRQPDIKHSKQMPLLDVHTWPRLWADGRLESHTQHGHCGVPGQGAA